MDIYLDHNSTTPLAPEVADALAEALRAGYANPASQHAAGRRARRVLEEAREGIAELLGAKTTGMDADQVIFTSGGTEANNLAIFGLVNWEGEAPRWEGEAPAEPSGLLDAANHIRPCGTQARQEPRPPKGRIVISSIEHPSVVGPAEALARRGWKLDRLRVTSGGVIDLDRARELLLLPLPTPRPALLSAMLANNETGVLQPVGELAKLCAEQNIPMHTDAAQVAGKLPLRFRELGVSAMTITAHKFHGPRGIGALAARHGVKLHPLLHGGFQQTGLRPGTEDVALAVGMHTALKLWQREADERAARMTMLRDRLEAQLLAGDAHAVINGATAPRLPHTTNVAFIGVNRQALLMALDLAGVACSTGSACASGSSEPSPVLLAMGCDEGVVEGALRLSLGATTTAAEVDEAARRILLAVKELRRQEK